jgi:peptidylprolyl isomerase
VLDTKVGTDMSPSPETTMVAIRGKIWENGAHQAAGQMSIRMNLMNDELQVIDLQLGEGKAAVKGALITTQYRGWLEDGTEFDSSYSRGKAFQCVIGTGRVIKGWDQGLMGMQVGGKRKLMVPAHLAYGERTMGKIPPNSNLIFEIELLEVLTRDD